MSSAIAQMARVLWSIEITAIVENPILDANTVNFYGTTTLWCKPYLDNLNRLGVGH